MGFRISTIWRTIAGKLMGSCNIGSNIIFHCCIACHWQLQYNQKDIGSSPTKVSSSAIFFIHLLGKLPVSHLLESIFLLSRHAWVGFMSVYDSWSADALFGFSFKSIWNGFDWKGVSWQACWNAKIVVPWKKCDEVTEEIFFFNGVFCSDCKGSFLQTWWANKAKVLVFSVLLWSYLIFNFINSVMCDP